jgi:hypothetical protein
MLSLQDKSSYEYEYESMIPSYEFMRYKFIEESIVHYSEVYAFVRGNIFVEYLSELLLWSAIGESFQASWCPSFRVCIVC